MLRTRMPPVISVACAVLVAACVETGPDGEPSSTTLSVDPDAEVCVTGMPEVLPDFRSLMEALNAGEQVRIVLDYERCLLSGSPGPAAVGGMGVDNWEFFSVGVVGNSKAYVATSQTHMVFLPSGATLNYVRVRVFEDSSVEVTAKYLSPTTYETSMNEVFSCTIDIGDGIGGATFLAPPRLPASG